MFDPMLSGLLLLSLTPVTNHPFLHRLLPPSTLSVNKSHGSHPVYPERILTPIAVRPGEVFRSKWIASVPSSSNPGSGSLFFDTGTLNQTTLSRTIFLGDCPGSSTSTIWASFSSSTTPPGGGLRVLIQNTSISGSVPYTDREYKEGGRSEKTNVTLGSEHRGKYFVVLPGTNVLSYQIYQPDNNKNIVETGSFPVEIRVNETQQVRSPETRTEQVCAVSTYGLQQCADYRTKYTVSCPDGRILRQTLYPDTTMLKTSIINSTSQPQSISVNGAPIYLYPGQQYEFFVNKYDSPQVMLGSSYFMIRSGMKNFIKSGYNGSLSISEY